LVLSASPRGMAGRPVLAASRMGRGPGGRQGRGETGWRRHTAAWARWNAASRLRVLRLRRPRPTPRRSSPPRCPQRPGTPEHSFLRRVRTWPCPAGRTHWWSRSATGARRAVPRPKARAPAVRVTARSGMPRRPRTARDRGQAPRVTGRGTPTPSVPGGYRTSRPPAAGAGHPSRARCPMRHRAVEWPRHGGNAGGGQSSGRRYPPVGARGCPAPGCRARACSRTNGVELSALAPRGLLLPARRVHEAIHRYYRDLARRAVLDGRCRCGQYRGPLGPFRLGPVIRDGQGRRGRGGSHRQGDGRRRPGLTGLPFFAAGRPGGTPLGLGLELDPPGLARGCSLLGEELA